MATDWKFPAISVRHGTPARREIKFLWNDRSPRDLSGLTGYFRVYQSATGEDLLFPEVTLGDGGEINVRVLELTAAQCTQTQASYYAEIEFRNGSGQPVEDGGWYGELRIEGK